MTYEDHECRDARERLRSRTRLGRAVCAFGTLLALALGADDALAVKPAEVFVTAKSSFSIDPSLGFGQYMGTIRYTRVDVVRPLDAKVTNKIAKKARKACLKLFVEGNAAIYPAFIIYDHLGYTSNQGGIRRLSVQGNPFVIDGAGNWTANAFSTNDPTKRVRAQGGFWWDTYYNFRQTEYATTFKVGAKKIQADCDGDITLETDYPG